MFPTAVPPAPRPTWTTRGRDVWDVRRGACSPFLAIGRRAVGYRPTIARAAAGQGLTAPVLIA